MFSKKLMLWALGGILLLGSASAAEVVIHTPPPREIYEFRGKVPEKGFVWISGYYRWDGAAFAWVPGKWEQPPRKKAKWQPHRWVKRKDGWLFVEGSWK